MEAFLRLVELIRGSWASFQALLAMCAAPCLILERIRFWEVELSLGFAALVLVLVLACMIPRVGKSYCLSCGYF